MGNRKRVNISVDPETYEQLQRLKQEYGFKNACELVVAIVHILVDRMKRVDERKFDLPEDDGRYIDEMFEELSYIQQTLNPDTLENRITKSIK